MLKLIGCFFGLGLTSISFGNVLLQDYTVFMDKIKTTENDLELEQNVQYFCDKSSFDAVAYSQLQYRSHQEMDNFIENADTHMSYADSWVLSLVPKESTRIRAQGENFQHLYTDLVDVEKILEKELIPLTAEEVDSIKKRILERFEELDQQTEIASVSNVASRTFACSLLTFKSLLVCQNALLRIEEIMNQRGGYVLPDANIEILVTESYREGLRKAALKILNKAKVNGVPEGDLFSDIKNSFLESGLSEETALQHTWTTMGILATGGPNYAPRVSNFGSIDSNFSTKIAISAIAQSLPLLDWKSRSNKRYYSYPEGIKTHCDNGKPYHFWMSAYLVKRLYDEFKDIDGVAAAAFSAAKGYQFLSRSAGREPERSMYLDPFAGINNMIRMDLVYSAAGVRHGILMAETPSEKELIDIDQGIRHALKEAEESENLSVADSVNQYEGSFQTVYFKWAARYVPDVIYKFFNK